MGFWAVVVGWSVLLGLGDLTPATWWAYHIPFYSRFRVVARHLFLASFGLIVLAAFGIVAVRRRRASARAAWAAGGLLAVALAVGGTLIFVTPEVVPVSEFSRRLWVPYMLNSTVWLQIGLGLTTIVVAGIAAIRPRRSGPWIAFLVVLLIDLLGSQNVALNLGGFKGPQLLPGPAVRPSVHTEALREDLSESWQRVTPFDGSTRDAVVPGTFARVWRIASAGGYNSLLLRNHGMLAQMEHNGRLRPQSLRFAHRGLDLLAVRYLIVRSSDLVSDSSIDEHGLEWVDDDFDIKIEPGKCADETPGKFVARLPAVPVSRVALVAHLRCSEGLEQGELIGRVRVNPKQGEAITSQLRAGIELSEWLHGLRELKGRLQHDRAKVFKEHDRGDAGKAYDYLVEIDLDQPVVVDSISIETTGIYGWMILEKITLVETSGRSLPQTLPAIFLRDSSRWRMKERLETSRRTDRGRDEEAEGEQEFLLFENRRALPRSWIVSEVLELAEPQVIRAIRTSELPDGRVFDPWTTALVQPGEVPSEDLGTMAGTGTALESTSSIPWWADRHEGSSVEIETVEDGRLQLSADAPRGGFLVLADTWYPGWEATVDGESTAVYRTDLSLRGIVLPPGEHRVEFRFVPRSLYSGAVLSGLAVIAICLAGFGLVRFPPTGKRREPEGEGGLDV